MWTGPLDQNSNAAIFKVVVVLERTIHLDPGLVSLKSSYDLVTRARLWAMLAGPLDHNSNAAIFKTVVFFGKNYLFGPRISFVEELL